MIRPHSSHGQLASRTSSMNVLRSTPPMSAIIVYAARASRARLSTEPSETRRSLTSGCCSTPSALLSESRTSSRSTCWSSSTLRIPRGRAASWRYGTVAARARRRACGGRSRPPGRRRAWRWSEPGAGRGRASISASVAATSAVAKSPKPTVPSGRRTMRSKSMSEWVMPAAPSWRNSSHRPSTAASGRSIVPGATGWPSGRTTNRASPLPALPGDDEPRGSHPGPLGQQGDEPLVLDELESAQPRRPLRAAVPQQPPHRGEQLGIPGIASVDLDRQRPDIVGGGEQHDARAVHRHRLELAGVDAELAQCPFDAGVRRAPTGRPDDEVHDRRRQQADRGRGDRPADRQRAEQHRADDAAPMSHRPRCRNGRVRYGDATAIAALAMVMAPGGNEGGPSRPMNRQAEPQEPPVMSTCRPSVASPPRAIPAVIEASSTMRRRAAATTTSASAHPSAVQTKADHSGSKKSGNDSASAMAAAPTSLATECSTPTSTMTKAVRIASAMSVGRRASGSCEPDANSSRPPERRRADGAVVTVAGVGAPGIGRDRRHGGRVVRGPSRSLRRRRSGAPAAGRHPPHRASLVGREGFEPPKAMPADLQSAPFGHSGTDPSPGTRERARSYRRVRESQRRIASGDAQLRCRVRGGHARGPQRRRPGPAGDRHPLRLQGHRLVDRAERSVTLEASARTGSGPCVRCSRRSS